MFINITLVRGDIVHQIDFQAHIFHVNVYLEVIMGLHITRNAILCGNRVKSGSHQVLEISTVVYEEIEIV